MGCLARQHGSTYGGTPQVPWCIVFMMYSLTRIMNNAVTEGQFIRETLVDALDSMASVRAAQV